MGQEMKTLHAVMYHGLGSIKEIVRRFQLDYKSIHLLLNEPDFATEWCTMTAAERATLKQLILGGYRKEVRRLVKEYRVRMWGSMTIEQMKEAAKKKQIVGWSRMTKLELLAALDSAAGKE